MAEVDREKAGRTRAPAVTHAHIEHSPDESIHGNGAPVQKVIHNDHSSKTLAIVALVVAGALGGLALGITITALVFGSTLIDSQIKAGAAQAEATAREARTTAKVTEDKLGELRDYLNSKGMNIPKLDGH
jgi:hypothetical protein